MHKLSLFGLLTCLASAGASLSNSTFSPKACTNYKIRREWGSTPKSTRKSFIAGVKCLMEKPSIIPSGLAPGALNRYDDFIATHINQTYEVHGDGVFITWHREFIRLFETALKTECGYNDTIPYWDFGKWAGNLSASSIFDGNDTSLSGDGLYNASSPTPLLGRTAFPKGKGGGPVVTGPFANLTLHFKNFDQADTIGFQGVLLAGSLDYHPHPFRRDLNSFIATHLTNQSAQDYLMYKATNISDFQNYLSEDATALALHPGAHYSAGQDLWDFFASPSGMCSLYILELSFFSR